MENNITTSDDATVTEPKTSTDVEIEMLKKQIADMQSRYDKAIADYQTENRKLYAHAVGNDTDVATDKVPSFDYDKSINVCYTYLGIKG